MTFFHSVGALVATIAPDAPLDKLPKYVLPSQLPFVRSFHSIVQTLYYLRDFFDQSTRKIPEEKFSRKLESPVARF